jgi:hypothetical protein
MFETIKNPINTPWKIKVEGEKEVRKKVINKLYSVKV